RIDVLEVRVGAPAYRAVRGRRAADGHGSADRDRGRSDARRRRRASERERRCRGGKLGDHREIVFGRTGRVRVTMPTLSLESSGTNLRYSRFARFCTVDVAPRYTRSFTPFRIRFASEMSRKESVRRLRPNEVRVPPSLRTLSFP